MSLLTSLGRKLEPLFSVLSTVVTFDRYRMQHVAQLYIRDEKVPGEYFEFGSRGGRSLVYAYKIAQRLSAKNSMRYYAFDSFEGFPEPKGIDSKGFVRFKKGEAFGSRKEFDTYLHKNKVKKSSVTVVQGFYSDTLHEGTRKKIGKVKAAIINIDCDMYQSAIEALNFMTPYVQSGTVIMFDDYYCYKGNPEQGEQRAIKEWLKKNKNIELIPWRHYATVGKSFIVHIRGK